MDDRDLDALERAVALAKAAYPTQISTKLASDSWIEVARFCAYSCQIDALKLAPHQMPPSELDPAHVNGVDRDDQIWGGAARLLKKMITADLSRYEPDPLSAFARLNLGVIYGATA